VSKVYFQKFTTEAETRTIKIDLFNGSLMLEIEKIEDFQSFESILSEIQGKFLS
jgi:hypothetical protein